MLEFVYAEKRVDRLGGKTIDSISLEDDNGDALVRGISAKRILRITKELFVLDGTIYRRPMIDLFMALSYFTMLL